MNLKQAMISLLLLVCHVTGNDIVQREPDPVAQLTTVTEHLTSQINNLTTKVTHLETQLQSTNHQLTVKSAVITNLTKELRNREHQLDILNNFCHNNVHSLSGRISTLELPVSFVVHFKNDSVVPGLTKQVNGRYYRLLFDAIQFQNGGQNYNKSTGYFVAPSAGTYAFFLTIQRRQQYDNLCVQASIFKNTGVVLSVASACPDGYSSSSNMGITHLNKGETVWVRSGDSTHMFGYIHTVFSGFKLTPH